MSSDVTSEIASIWESEYGTDWREPSATSGTDAECQLDTALFLDTIWLSA